LQLPLYRKVVEGLSSGRPIETAYLALTADPKESILAPFSLKEAEIESAERCAEEVASRVRKGIFWPPQPLRSSAWDPFGLLFMEGRFEECIDEATISFLKGVES
jgi:hypothetical protein